MKEKLQNALGTFGGILYWILTILIAILPLVMIDMPSLVDFIILAVCSFLPFLSIPLWIWGLVEAIKGPQDIFAIVYYIATVAIFLPTIISMISGFIGKRKENKAEKQNNLDKEKDDYIVKGWKGENWDTYKTTYKSKKPYLDSDENIINVSNFTLTEKIVGAFGVNIVSYLKKADINILTTNIYSAADAYLSVTYIITFKVLFSSLSEDKKEQILSIIIPLIGIGITKEFNFPNEYFSNIAEKRDTYFSKFIKNVCDNEEIMLSDVTDEISKILKYDITYDKYIEFNETTEILIMEADKSLQIELAIMKWHKFTIDLMNNLLEANI